MYKDILEEAFKRKKLTLRKAIILLKENSNVELNYSYLSKLRSGNRSPASDKVNDALAQILEIDPIELKVAAYREKIPAEVLEHINNTA
ncbi:XRE family transcriptional regulator [Paenibacillus sp. FSL M7-0547]|uniref:XRE family transcriptional regulator n=1 Tax=Paenibacillus sp. FSL M7-0547 TaxID=2954755 RepID=UPI0030FC90A5